MINVENLSYSFPEKDLYHNISFTLEENQHCALIGSSGTGKSTLIEILMDPEKFMFDGKLEITPKCRIGYVSQFSQLDKTRDITVFEYLAEEFVNLQNKIYAICMEMETSEELDTLLEQYEQALSAFHAVDGDNFESNIMKKLNLANLSKLEDLMVSKLSGGEFKLIQVIKESLIAPDLMIMDEPDVFLDFEHQNALKNLINTHKGMMLVITHSRYLLNHCFNKIIHLENTELQEFDGNYMEYNFSLLQRKIELQELAFADAEEIERNKKVVDKLRFNATYYTCASRGRTLHARVTHLERLEARRIKEPFVEIKQPEIRLYAEQELNDTLVVKVKDYSVSFQDELLKNVNFEIGSKDKVAIVGPNGSGKTTLLRDLYHNNHKAIQIDENVKLAFLSQLQGEMLNESNTIQDEFFEIGFQTYDEISTYLSAYGFAEENMKQTIASLSGGEKNLLQLAKISVSKANVLLLDEPTSHLDTYSQIALEEAISNYNGAVLMISHDFYTIVNCMDYILLIENKTIRKVSIRKFRKMIYENHYDKDYIEAEQKKKEVETGIALALKDTNFTVAKELSEELEGLIQLL